MAFAPLTWTNFRNTDAFPSTDALRKISGVDGAWDADAVSSEQIASAIAGLGIEFVLGPVVHGGAACGLSSDNPTASYDTIDYCMLLWEIEMPLTEIYENGALRYQSFDPLIASGPFKIIINDALQIEYYSDITLLYTSLIAPTFPLFADASIFFYGRGITSAQIDTGVVAKVDHLMMMGVH